MAGLGAGQFNKALGEAIFGQPKRNTIYANDPLNTMLTGSYIDALKGLRTTSGQATTDFASELARMTPEARRIQGEDISLLGNMAADSVKWNPMDYYNELLGAKVSGPNGIKSFVPDLMGANSKLNSTRALAAGINGTTNTAYNTRTGLSQLGQSLAPILSGIYGGTGAEANSMANNRLANIGSTVNLLRERSGVPDRLAFRALMPAQASANLLGGELNLAGTVGDISKSNIQGYEMKSNPWANLMEAGGSSLDSTADFALDAFKTYMGGSIGGGGGAKASSMPIGGTGGGGVSSMSTGGGGFPNYYSNTTQPVSGGWLGYDYSGNPVTRAPYMGPQYYNPSSANAGYQMAPSDWYTPTSSYVPGYQNGEIPGFSPGATPTYY